MKKIYLLLSIVAFASVSFADQGKQSYDTRCASCHGATGAADGVVAKSLPPGIVTNLIKGPFKYATDEAKLKELIVKGGAALKLNAMMPPAPGMSDAELTALVKYVMGMRK